MFPTIIRIEALNVLCDSLTDSYIALTLLALLEGMLVWFEATETGRR